MNAKTSPFEVEIDFGDQSSTEGRLKGSPAITHFQALAQLLSEENLSRARTYKTRVAIEECTYVFSTTSKALHLQIGAMREDTQEQLALLLESVFATSKDLVAVLLFQARTSLQDARYAIRVTRTRRGGIRFFDLSLAHGSPSRTGH